MMGRAAACVNFILESDWGGDSAFPRSELGSIPVVVVIKGLAY